jgi:hypothetical protein
MDTLDHSFDLRREARRERMPSHLSPDVSHFTIFDIFEPEAVCITDERFGSQKRYDAFDDGPKFVCGVDVLAAKAKTSSGCLVYSIGSNNNIFFEAAVSNFIGCEIHTFDPTLSKPFVGDQYATFHPWGLGEDGKNDSFENKKWISKSLATFVRELGHENRTIDILKVCSITYTIPICFTVDSPEICFSSVISAYSFQVDCEGCEWTTLPPFFDLVASGNFRVGQVQVELHQFVLRPNELAQFFSAVDKAKLRVFHKERNPWCSGYKCAEYSFVSESFLREVNRVTTCPQ